MNKLFLGLIGLTKNDADETVEQLIDHSLEALAIENREITAE